MPAGAQLHSLADAQRTNQLEAIAVRHCGIGGFVVIPRGTRGMGEVTWKTGKGAFGKSGKMEIELRFIEVGGQRIAVDGKYRQEGEGNTVAAIGTVLYFHVFGALVTGKSALIPRGRELSARTRDAIPVILPAGASLPPTGVIVATPAVAGCTPVTDGEQFERHGCACSRKRASTTATAAR